MPSIWRASRLAEVESFQVAWVFVMWSPVKNKQLVAERRYQWWPVVQRKYRFGLLDY